MDAIDSYAAGTGTVEGNRRPIALIEAEQTVTAYEIMFNKIEELTGADSVAALANIQELQGSGGTLDENSIWGQAAKLLEEVEAETGVSYYDALHSKEEQESLFEEVQHYSDISYLSDEEAAVAFAQTADAETKGDGNERVAIILNIEVPVINSKGEIVYEPRSVLGDTMEGQPRHVIPQLLALYVTKGLIYPDATVSFIHTHPGAANEFSGEEGETPMDILEQIRKYITKEDNTHFSYFLGDAQVPWLPKVDRMYLVSPKYGEIYACDSNGPITDSTSSSGYQVMATY